MQRKSTATSFFIQKYPDGERADIGTQRISFMGVEYDEEDDGKANPFRNLTQLRGSPTQGEKSPFSKTPREQVGGKGNSGKRDSDEKEEKEASSSQGETRTGKDGKKGKFGVLARLLFSKLRNRQ